MILTREFLDDPIDDLAAPEFQDRLRKELSLSPFTAILAFFGALVSGGVLLGAVLVVVGHLRDPSGRSLLGICLFAVVGMGCAFVLHNLVRRWCQRRAYQALLVTPSEWRIQSAVATRVSRLAFPTIGSDEAAIRIFWEGDSPGSASLEMLEYKVGQPLAVAVRSR